MSAKYSSNLSTTIEVMLPGATQPRKITGAQVNFKMTLNDLIPYLQLCTRLAPEDPKIIADKVEIVVGKERRELTQEVLQERQEYFFSQAKKPSVQIILHAHIDTSTTVRAASRGRASCAPGTMPPPRAATPGRSSNPGRARAVTAAPEAAVVPPPAPVPAVARVAASAAASIAAPVAAPVVAAPVVASVAVQAAAPTPITTAPIAVSAPTTNPTISSKKVKTTKKEPTPEEIAAQKRAARQQKGIQASFRDVDDAEGATDEAAKLSAFDFAPSPTAKEASDSSDEESDEEESEPAATETVVTQLFAEIPAVTTETSVVEPAEAPVAVTAAPSTPPRPTSAVIEATPIPAAACTDAPVPATPSASACADEAPAAPATPSVPKTPNRSASRTRTGVRSSIMSSTKSSSMRTTDDNSLYGQSRTYSEQKMHIMNGLHSTTGSLALAHATKSAAAMRVSAAPQLTPAKKLSKVNVPNDGMDDAFAAQMASANKIKRNPDGRPSIGTIENQWEYMRQNFFNNDDEEITWSMVSRNKGAYKHAHMKYQRAEDRYFKSLYDITSVEEKIQSMTSGPAAKVVTLITALANLTGRYLEVPASPETNAQIDEVIEKLRVLVASGSPAGDATVQSLKDTINENTVLDPFTSKTAAIVLTCFEETMRGKMLREVRNHSLTLSTEMTTLKGALNKANKDSEEALEYMEKWSRREKDANDYAETIRQEEVAWLDEQSSENHSALIAMRTFLPLGVADMSVPEIMQATKDAGGLLSLELATELKQNKLLHWIVTHTEDIALDSFLTGDRKAIFETFDTLDITELRALACVLPMRFENDKDGKKAEWRARFFAKVRAIVSQQNGDLVKGPYNPVEGKRTLVKQAPLKPEQIRRAVYYYRTKEKSLLKVKQYNDRVALLARREAALAHAETAAATAKTEYDIVLSEMRDPAFIEEYGAERLTLAKEQAKDMLTTANSTLKSARMDLTNLRNTIAAMPVSREQYLEQEEELVAFLKANNGIDWTQRGLAPVLIEGVLLPVLEVPKTEKVSSKALTAEEEAVLRKQEMERIFSKKPDFTAAAVSEAPTDAPCTPAPEAATADIATGPVLNAPNPEFRRLSVAAASSIFSPSMVRRQDSLFPATPSDNLAQEFATPRKRNSVLANANPDMLNTLNKMMLNSPAATPSGKMGRPSVFMPQSAAKLAAAAASSADENGGKVVEKKPVATRSEILKRLLNPTPVSPKRTPLSALGGMMGPPTGAIGGPPKLGFLAQLTARVGLKSAGTTAATESSSTATAAPAMPAKSLFADILKFRKPDSEEVATTGTTAAAAEDKENFRAASVNEVSEAPSGLSKPMLPAASAAAARPMMSLFDEIRKRRVVE